MKIILSILFIFFRLNKLQFVKTLFIISQLLIFVNSPFDFFLQPQAFQFAHICLLCVFKSIDITTFLNFEKLHHFLFVLTGSALSVLFLFQKIKNSAILLGLAPFFCFLFSFLHLKFSLYTASPFYKIIYWRTCNMLFCYIIIKKVYISFSHWYICVSAKPFVTQTHFHHFLDTLSKTNVLGHTVWIDSLTVLYTSSFLFPKY